MKSFTRTSAEPLRVWVLETSASTPKGWHSCVVGKHVNFLTDGLESFCFAAARPEVYDLILLAASVELCDKSRRRPRHGWKRRFMLDVPVHDDARWNKPNVTQLLRHALELLTGDEWNIHFRARSRPIPAPNSPTLPLPVHVGAVMPYSDGLDSRAVAAIVRKSIQGQLMRVRLGPVNDPDGAGQKHFAKIPYTVRPLEKAAESSGRSRAFKFTALAGIAAALSGTNRIIMSESMQGALGPAILPVGHAYEDYRNHPMFTHVMGRFLSAILEHSVTLEFPRLWNTKAETLRKAMELGIAPEQLMSTRSCWQNSRQVSHNGSRRQCGICAACMLRRQSLAAAGVKEPSGTYVWENLSAPSFEAATLDGFSQDLITTAQHEYAIAGTLHMEHLAEFAQGTASAEELAHAAYRLAGPLSLQQADVLHRMSDGFERHRIEWRAFLAALAPDSFIHAWTKGDLS